MRKDEDNERRENLRLVTEDETIVARLKEGGPGAANLLWEKFDDEISALVWHLLGADQEHQDIVHLVYCEILANVKNIKFPESLRAWIRGVTVRIVRKQIRKRVLKRRMGLESELDDRFLTTRDDPENREYIKRAIRIIRGMSPSDSVVFVLKHIEKYSMAELSSVLGCSERHARRKLRKAETRFERLARRDSVLKDMFKEGSENDESTCRKDS